MRVYSLLYRTANNLKTFIVNNQIDKTKSHLVLVHTDILKKQEIAPIVSQIGALLPNAQIIGCSVGGIIYRGQSLSNQTLISILDCYNTSVKTVCVSLKDGDKYKTPSRLADDVLYFLGGGDDSFMFAYYSPTYPYMSQAIEEINKRAKNHKIIGGGAYSVGDNLLTCPPYVINNSRIEEEYIVVGKLKSPILRFEQTAVTGIKAVGRTYKVTKSEEHRIKEIDNQPAKQWLNFMVGEEYLTRDPNIIFSIPLVRNGDERWGLNIAYGKDGITDADLGDDLFVFDSVKEGDEISAGYIDPVKTASSLEPFCNKLIQSPTEAMFGYSCLTRRNVLHNCAQWELRPFTATQIVGAFMAGELVYDSGKCHYSNSAFTVASLSEDVNARVNLNLRALEDSELLQFDSLPLVNYLFSTANSELKNELNDSRQKLAEQMITDSASGLPNLTKFVHDNEALGFNALCLVTLKNESVIRVFNKKQKYVEYIEAIASVCKQLLGDDHKIYRYNELSVLVAAHTADKKAFESDMRSVLSTLTAQSGKAHQTVYEISIVFGEEDLLSKVELTYLNLHKSDKNVLINDEENGGTLKKEMALLQVVNDAINNKLIIPFYQGIMNNKTQKIDMCESLMRLTDKNGRIYLPGEFLPVAKEYTLYEKLSYQMIETVLETVPKLPITVTINLNVSDVFNQETVNMIFDHLKKLEHPEKVVFEIVESEEITDYAYFKAFTDKIHSFGAKIAIDDFGSGYSNIMHIIKIDLDYIKIAGEIVKEICDDKTCRDFVSMITDWANLHDRLVIAEYVENEDIQKKLKRYKVSYSQGYLFSKPKKLD